MLETKNYILNLPEEFIKKFKNVFSIKKKFGRECSWGSTFGEGKRGKQDWAGAEVGLQ